MDKVTRFPMALTGDPELDPHPSVAEPEEEFCPYCEAMPDEDHKPFCPMAETIDADDIHFCESCGRGYTTVCGCDEEWDRDR